MKKVILGLMLGLMVAFIPSCSGGDKTQQDLPQGVGSRKELNEMKKHPEDYTKKELEAAGMDSSAGKDEEPGAENPPAEGAPAGQ